MPTAPSSFVATIMQALVKFQHDVLSKRPDQKENSGTILSHLMFWDEVQSYAKKQSDTLWKQYQDEGVYTTEGLDPGQHTLLESRHFTMGCKISNPVRRFNADEMVRLLVTGKYKVPAPVAKKMVEDAKIPGKSTVTLSIEERS